MTEVQAYILNIYKEIDQICKNNNIPFFAIGGTCIGAVRHRGFIPWDDDLDIAIPIEYYFQFLSLAEKLLPSHLTLYTSKYHLHYPKISCKIIDERTTFIESQNYQYPDAYTGVFVDIMPICGVPRPGIKRRIFFLCQKWFFSWNFCIRFSPKETRKQKLASFLAEKYMNDKHKFDHFSQKWLSIMKKYPMKTAQFTGYVWSHQLPTLVFPIQYFQNTVRIPFEDTTMPCPILYHKYLTDQFRDYMTLPPEIERSCHNGIILLDKSYHDFQSNLDLIKKYLV